MVKIKDGTGGEELNIKIFKGSSGECAELWIEFGTEKVKKESLSYMTLEEVLALRNECNKVLLDILGLGENK